MRTNEKEVTIITISSDAQQAQHQLLKCFHSDIYVTIVQIQSNSFLKMDKTEM